MDTPAPARPSQAGLLTGSVDEAASRSIWKVLVLGNSVPTTVARETRLDGTYGEVLEWMLRASGHDATVSNAGRWFDEINDGARRFMDAERTNFPDVLIIHYGFNECRPRVVPTRLLRHVARLRFHTWDEGVSPAGRAYRHLVAPHLWEAVRGYQRAAAATAGGQRTWRMRPERFAAELERLIKFARHERMLVFVVDITPPGPKLVHFIPGFDRRWARYQQLLADVVDGFADPEVRLLPASQVVAELGADRALSDGMHFSPAGHRRVAEMLVAEIEPWLGMYQEVGLEAEQG